jgi:hypothetical protein
MLSDLFALSFVPARGGWLVATGCESRLGMAAETSVLLPRAGARSAKDIGMWAC